MEKSLREILYEGVSGVVRTTGEFSIRTTNGGSADPHVPEGLEAGRNTGSNPRWESFVKRGFTGKQRPSQPRVTSSKAVRGRKLHLPPPSTLWPRIPAGRVHHGSQKVREPIDTVHRAGSRTGKCKEGG